MQTFVLQRNSDVVREVYTWILGRLSTATWGDVRLVLPYVVLSGVVLLLHRRHLDVLRVGDDEAAHARDPGGPHPAGGRRRRDARHGGGRLGQRADRLRRVGRAAHRAADRRRQLPAPAAAVDGCSARRS
jgi:hypothetical protein